MVIYYGRIRRNHLKQINVYVTVCIPKNTVNHADPLINLRNATQISDKKSIPTSSLFDPKQDPSEPEIKSNSNNISQIRLFNPFSVQSMIIPIELSSNDATKIPQKATTALVDSTLPSKGLYKVIEWSNGQGNDAHSPWRVREFRNKDRMM